MLRAALVPILLLIISHNLKRSFSNLAASVPTSGSGGQSQTSSGSGEPRSRPEEGPGSASTSKGQSPDDVVRGFAGRKSVQKWQSQTIERGWTAGDIEETIADGQQSPAENRVNPENTATRYVHPRTGRSVVIVNQTGKVIQLGGDGFGHY